MARRGWLAGRANHPGVARHHRCDRGGQDDDAGDQTGQLHRFLSGEPRGGPGAGPFTPPMILAGTTRPKLPDSWWTGRRGGPWTAPRDTGWPGVLGPAGFRCGEFSSTRGEQLAVPRHDPERSSDCNGHASQRQGSGGGWPDLAAEHGRRRAAASWPCMRRMRWPHPPRHRHAGRPPRGRGRGPGGVLRPVPALGPARRPGNAQRYVRAAVLTAAARRCARIGPAPRPGRTWLDTPGGAGRALGEPSTASAERAAAAARAAAGGFSAAVLPGPARAGDRPVDGRQPGHGEVHHIPRAGRARPPGPGGAR